MIINLKQLFNIVGESKDIEYSIEAEELNGIKGLKFSMPISVNGRIFNRAGVVHLKYTVASNLLTACDRCLKELELPFSFECEDIVCLL